MSQQLYIFGRPVSASNDNELGGPPDETRSPMATAYQRPQPPLNFGSDTLSFTDPRRYETKSQPQRTNEPNRLAFSDTSRGTRHESIPPVSQLLTPGSQPSIPPSPFSPQYTPELQRQSSLRSSHKDQTSERLPQIPGHPYQGMYQHSQPPAQVQDHGIVIQRRDNYQSSPPFHFDPKSHGQNQSPNVVPYAAYPPRDTQVPYAPQPQIARAVPLDVPQQYPHQQLAAVNTSNQTQQTYPMRTPGQYYQDILGNRPLSIDPGLGPERGESNSTNVIKPQPRVVSDALVPGEGPVWVYEDGTTCPKVVDGELVNANWGITKAGKPRKRLAMACTTCREKKIKCDPAEPKCVQCEKFGRECRFSTA